MSKLAINGGVPVREKFLAPAWPGAFMYGEEEARAVYEICMKKSPFRYYGYDNIGAVKDFEEKVQKRFGVKYALGVTSCTAALIVALKAAGIGPGDKVIVPACTFIATAGAVICAGAVPIFADVDDTLNIDPKKIGSLVDKYTKAVIAVPLLGSPCEMDAIVAEAKKHNLVVIEDVAQSMGSSYKGKCMGAWGDVSVFSLQLNKMITTGEGGVVVTSDPKIYERALRYHDQGLVREPFDGFVDDPDTEIIGQNYRMSELTGAVAGVQFSRLDGIIKENRRIKKILLDELSGIDGLELRRCVDPEGDAAAAISFYLPTKEKTIEFNAAMCAENVGFFSQYEGRPVYLNPRILYQKTIDANGFPFNQFDEKIVYSEDMCPVANDYMPRSSYSFISPELTDRDIEDMITAVKKVSKEIL